MINNSASLPGEQGDKQQVTLVYEKLIIQTNLIISAL